VAAHDRVREDGGGRRARQPDALFVDQEHAVRVAVESEADIGPHLEHACDEVTLVLGLDRIRRVVRERPVELAEHDLEVERKRLEHRRDDQAAHPVGGVGNHLERLEHRHVDERTDVIGELGEQIPFGHRAGRADRSDAGGGEVADGEQPRLLADGTCSRQAELDAVVLRRVVRRREHRTRRAERAGREIEQIGRTEPEVDHVDALGTHTLAERGHQLDARRSHVSRHEDLRDGAAVVEGEAGERRSDRVAGGRSSIWSGKVPRMS
jgi:hypothetical protein